MISDLLQSTSEKHPKVSFVPVHWWQVVTFLRLNLQVVQGCDPLADRILSRPWALPSLLEYAFMLYRFLRSNALFIVVSGELAGLLWTVRWSKVYFTNTLGLLPRFQQRTIGTQTVALIEDLARHQGCTALAAAVAPNNEPVHRLIRACGGVPLGLATTKLTLAKSVNPSASPSINVEVRRVGRSKAIEAWNRWRLYEVERVAGHAGFDVATTFLRFLPLPRGKYLTLHQDNQEVGMVFARQRAGELEIGLFPSAEFWSGLQTEALITLLASHLGSSIRCLTLTQTHADTFAAFKPFDFERGREQERHFMFKLL